MYNICVFAGTSEGTQIINFLSDFKNIKTTACVATEYGEEIIQNTNCEIHRGRLDFEDMLSFFTANSFDIVIDATHPFAQIVSQNIVMATTQLGLEYLRVGREFKVAEYGTYFENTAHVVEYLSKEENIDGNILLTTGSKTLSEYNAVPNYKERIYARILPLEDSFDIAKHCGYKGAHIIAMQGPFSEEFNEALIKMYNIRYLVTKESGENSGFEEKIKAAQNTEIECLIIGKSLFEQKNKSYSLVECYNILKEKIPQNLNTKKKISIIGIGVGDLSQMTIGAYRTLENADIIIGAKRITKICESLGKPTKNIYLPDDVLEFVKGSTYKNIAVVLSGDIGFYSGAKKLYDVLSDFDLETICGISSPVYFTSRLKMSWEDIKLVSLHGRNTNIIDAVKTNHRVFTLVGGDMNAKKLCSLLCDFGFSDLKMYIGEKLSYKDEKITIDTAKNLKDLHFSELSCIIIENENYNNTRQIGICDDMFARVDKVPMTKSEVRALSLAKLELSKNSVVYDIGSGSGSVSVEIAKWAYNGMVYSVETNPYAVQATKENIKKFQLQSVEVVSGFAPDVLAELPVPTHAFIGGSSGNLIEIVECLFSKNPNIKIVINTITLQTISDVVAMTKELGLENYEIIQVNISKSKKLSDYDLMIAQNPIYIITL